MGRFAEHQVLQLRTRVTKLHSAVSSPVEGAEAERLQAEAKVCAPPGLAHGGKTGRFWSVRGA